MSCALASPDNGVCANRRPVRGRRAEQRRPSAPVQASLVPLAEGHAALVPLPAAQSETPRVAVAPPVPSVHATQGVPEDPAVATPFSATAPESTFSLTQVREAGGTPASPVGELPEQRLRSAPPSFREIRAGRAAAAARVPVAEVRIPIAELDGASMPMAASHAPSQAALPGMEQLVERVRQRTAARLSRSTALDHT